MTTECDMCCQLAHTFHKHKCTAGLQRIVILGHRYCSSTKRAWPQSRAEVGVHISYQVHYGTCVKIKPTDTEVDQHQTRLVLGWVTQVDTVWPYDSTTNAMCDHSLA